MGNKKDHEIWLQKVVGATKMVTAPYYTQETLLPEQLPLADEIALNFSDEVVNHVNYLLERKIITNTQFRKIKELDNKLSQMSDDKSQDYWTKEALKNSEVWEHCRKLAREILKEFDKKFLKE